jgi:hypothetical protein
MSTNVKEEAPLAAALDDGAAAELDIVLAGRRDDVERLLGEARIARAEGRYAPLEPMHDFLRRARERLTLSHYGNARSHLPS